MEKGSTYALAATVTPSDATNKAVTWSSSDTSVATVSSSGVITAVANGTATITATTADGGYTDTCGVTVSTSVTGVTLDNTSASLKPGDTLT
ncbi:MAG: Ig-like domain-containing protein, partial [Clostridia bacterium]|nr:Ig-like domain-containing protein [Clostridia bacterium]